jgi:hypothetical protein
MMLIPLIVAFWLFGFYLPIDCMHNPGEMDDDDDDGVLDDNLSVASVGTNNEVESNTDCDNDADGEWQSSATSEFNSNDGENDPEHYRNMGWNNETLMFEYMTDDHTKSTDGTPKLNQWKMIHPRAMTDVRVTFNEGRNTMVRHFKTEYDALMTRLDDLSIVKTTDGVFTYLFGPQSRLAEVMKRVLDITYEELAQFLATTYFAAELGITAKHLETHRSINYDGHMEQKRLNEIWTLISVAGKTGSSEKLWMEIQDAINKNLLELFLAEGSRPDVMRIAVDDDKVHFNMKTASMRGDGDFLCGMKLCQHIKSNCRGMTIDSAVSSATGYPLHFSVLRQGESNTDNYKRMLQSMFSHLFSRGEIMHEALNGIIFCSDRGYWTAPLIDLILSLGGTVFGTLKRAFWVPYTYDQKNTNGRENVDGKFGRSLFLAFSRWGKYMMKVVAWRSGTGGVALGMNSANTGDSEPPTMDFCFEHYSDGRWYMSNTITQEERNVKAFRREFERSNHSDELEKDITDHLIKLSSTIVTMLTVSDLDFGWFTLRMFAWTSSSVHATLRYTAPMIPPDDDIFNKFDDVLGYAGLSHLLRREGEVASLSGMSAESGSESCDVMTGEFVRLTIKLMQTLHLQEDDDEVISDLKSE